MDSLTLRLEPFELSDIQRLISWLDSEQTFWNWTAEWLRYPLTEEQYAPKVAETLLSPPKRYIFRVVEESSGEIVGNLEISEINRENKTASIGRVIVSPNHRQKGICKEMIRLAIEYAFELGFHHLDLQVSAENLAARRCYESVGFVDDGPMWEDARLRWMHLTLAYGETR